MTYRLSYTELAEGRVCIALDVDARTCLADQEAARESLLGLVEKVIGRPPDYAVDPVAQALRDGTLICPVTTPDALSHDPLDPNQP